MVLICEPVLVLCDDCVAVAVEHKDSHRAIDTLGHSDFGLINYRLCISCLLDQEKRIL
jgi:hypothetical protein